MLNHQQPTFLSRLCLHSSGCSFTWITNYIKDGHGHCDGIHWFVWCFNISSFCAKNLPKQQQQQQKTANKAHSSWSVLTGNCTVRQNSCQMTSFNKRKQKKTLQGQEIQFDDSKLLVLACGCWSKCTHPSL